MVGAVTSQDSEASGHGYALPAGTQLQEFRIESVLGHGGFGITYLAKDTARNETVAIKEYLPGDLAMRVSNSTVRARSSDDQKLFNDGVYSFLEEARRIARVTHPNIMEVKKFFTMNGTAYIVLRYERGKTLKQRFDSPISEKSLRSIMDGLLQGLAAIHDHDKALLHRDVKPSNIILSRNRSEREETPVLIDFGAAREFSNRNSRTVTALISPGYSPPEQYGAGGQQGPWSDLYAVGATAYRCVAGETPPDSLTRLGKDPMIPAAVRGKGKYSDDLLRLIDWMMTVKEAERPQSAQAALQALRASRDTSSAAGGDAGSGLRSISGVGRDDFVLEFDGPPASQTLGLAFKVTPPGRYLAPGKGDGYQKNPHFFSLDRVESEEGNIGFRGGAEIRRRLRRGAGVAISSADGSINADAKWPLLSGVRVVANAGFSKRFIIVTALSVLGFAAAAMNIGTIQDTICDRAGFCTAQQVLFRTANECVARTSSCGIDSCLGDFRNKATLPRLVDRMSAIETKAISACRGEDSAGYQKAKTCAEQKRSSNVCEVAACYAPYLSSFPNGDFVQEGRAAVNSARQACAAVAANKGAATPAPRPTQTSTPTPTPPPRPTPTPTPTPTASAVPPPVPQPQPSTPAVALPDGTYSAVRTFVDAKSVSDPASCPPSTNIQVTVRGSVIRFENYENNTGITRKWKGDVLPNGEISFLGTEATPPTANYLTIIGPYGTARIDSRFCGKGFFKITK